MAAGNWKLYRTAKVAMMMGGLDFRHHAFKVRLYQRASNCVDMAGVTYLADLTDAVPNVAAQPVALTLLDADGAVTVGAAPVVWTAEGGPITAAFAVLYDADYPSQLPVAVCVLDLEGADVTATDGNTLTVTTAESGLFALYGAAVDV